MSSRCSRSLRRPVLVAALLVCLASLTWAATASAAVVVGGGCTLSEAVAAANTHADANGCTGVAPSGQTTISVPTGNYALAGSELKVTASMKLVGDGEGSTIIDGGSLTRVFEVVSGGQLALETLKVTGGKAPDGANGDTSGACSHIGAGCPGDNGGGILNAGALTLNHVTVTGNSAGHGGLGNNGDGSTNPTFHSGQDGNVGGSGGGIFNDFNANLTITASTITNNHTGAGGNGGSGGVGNGASSAPYGGEAGIGSPSGAGGGVYNGGSATITDTTIASNTTGRGGNGGDGGNGAGTGTPGAGGDGGRGGNNGWLNDDVHALPSFYGGGGGIATFGPLTVTGSTISGNATGAGGNGGSSGTSHSGGASPGTGGGGGWGGGVAILGDDPNASFTNTTIANNVTGDGGHGGGGPSGAAGYGGTGGDGGGLHTVGVPHSGGVAIDHVTIAGNAVGAGGAAYNITIDGRDGTGGGIRTDEHNSPPGGNGITLKNSMVSRNEAPNCVRSVADGGQGDFLDQGGNVQWNVVSAEQANDTSCPGTYGDTQLGTLQNNGGPTLTMLPGGASSAIDAATCDVLTDQRGIARPASACDSGAVEAGALPPPTDTSTALGASPNPSTAGQAVTYTATVSPAPNGGTVAFKDAGTVIFNCGSRPVTSGTATCITTYGAAGSHTITAAYSGTSAYATSSAPPLTQVVKAKPATGGGGGTKPPGGGGSSPPKPVAPRNTALPVVSGSATAGKTLTTTRGAWTGTAAIAFAYRWQRCTPTCRSIAGATGPTYVLKAGDAGGRIRSHVIASNAASDGVSAFSAQTGAVIPSATTVKKFLGKLLSPGGKAGKIGALLKAGGYKFSATAPSAGTLTLSWYQVPKGAKAVSAKKKKAKKAVLVATVKTTVKKAGKVKPKIKLTAKGKKLLKHAKKIKLTAKQTFKPKGGKATVVRKPFKLKR